MQAGGAGYTEWLMFHIWRPSTATGRCCPNVALPETVICRWSRPFYWYFTSESGEILRTVKGKVSFDNIRKHFLESVAKSGVVAQYLAFGNNKQMSATVEFLAQEDFNDFIERRDKAMSSIIQCWVEPRQNHNSMIRVVWSPQFCLIEKKQNLHALDDAEVDFYDKLATFEGLEQCSETIPVTSTVLVASVQQACLSISEHIKALTGGNVVITSMTLYFKEDKKGKLWLLFCLHLKLFDIHRERVKDMLEVKLTLPEIAKTKLFTRDRTYFELERNRKPCPSCNGLVKGSSMHQIETKFILKCLNKGIPEPQQLGAPSTECDVDEVPWIVRRLNDSENQSNYLDLKQDFKFLETQLLVCENCYLHYAHHYFEAEPQPGISPKKTDIVDVPIRLKVPDIKKPKKFDLGRLASLKITSPRSEVRIHYSSRLVSPTTATSPTSLPSINLRKQPTLKQIYMNSPRSPKISGLTTKAPSSLGRYTPSSTFRLSELPNAEQADFLIDLVQKIKKAIS